VVAAAYTLGEGHEGNRALQTIDRHHRGLLKQAPRTTAFLSGGPAKARRGKAPTWPPRHLGRMAGKNEAWLMVGDSLQRGRSRDRQGRSRDQDSTA